MIGSKTIFLFNCVRILKNVGVAMGFIMNLLPMNVFPLILVLMYENAFLARRYLGMDISNVITQYDFLFMVSALLLFTLSYEMIKAAMFAPKGSGAWVDFIMSFLLFIAIILYIFNSITDPDKSPSKLIILIAEAQLFDVVVGFYLTITNARRDFNAGG
jgi:hypothetical protein